MLLRWTEAFCAGDSPSPRSSHAAAVVGDTLFVVGGQAKGHVFSDAYVLCLVTLSWRQASSCLASTHQSAKSQSNFIEKAEDRL